jgi:hypothetical protein
MAAAVPHPHEIGMRLRSITLAGEVVALYRCRHCPRHLVQSPDRQVPQELGDAVLCRCTGAATVARRA